MVMALYGNITRRATYSRDGSVGCVTDPYCYTAPGLFLRIDYNDILRVLLPTEDQSGVQTWFKTI